MSIFTNLKRFTETDKWRDPWFRKLSSPAKQLWGYLLDQCDKIGLVEIDLTLASTDCGQQITESHLSEIGDRIERCNNGKFFIPKFIHFQYGVLTRTCPPHRTVISLVEAHNLIRDGLLYHYPNARVTIGHKTRKDKNGKEEEGESEGKPIELPSGFPDNPDSAVVHADFVGCSKSYALEVWNDAMARGGRDGADVPIRDFRRYLAKRLRLKQASDAEKNGYKPHTGGNF